MPSDWLSALSGWLYSALVVILLITVLLRKEEAASALAWSLAIVFVPVIGPLFFLAFGLNRVPRRLLHKIAHHERFDDRFQLPEPVDARDREHVIGYPEGDRGALGEIIEALGEAPRRGGNETRIYSEGGRAFDDMYAAIEQARHHVHIEYYIFRNDEVGRRFLDLLVRKVREGVEVRLILDAIGSARAWRLLRRLRRAGGFAAAFTHFPHLFRVSPNLRNHRKIIVCDGQVAFFGGMNVGKEYLGRIGRRGRDWYDLHMRIRGPSVRDLQLIFIEDWDYSTGETIDAPAYFPTLEPAPENAPVQIVAGGPDVATNPIRQAFFWALTHARRRIYISTPYLVPDLALREALMTSARAGVEIHIVTQSAPPDSYLAYWCGRYFARELVAAGVHVHAYRPGMVHAKAMAVDGEWALLGTANLDNRSMFLNFEQLAILDDPGDVETIESELRGLVARSTRIDTATLAGRTRIEKLLATGARLFAPLL